ncbi:UNVERIFIED_CONTAM: Retrovirus-related Pol polyprotein from transposon RE1 [Sesamum radiatum]|uniref:Retrovirus-related Pol polyprotein from transposon RE1 n=1 Tax=Sesamum radiatum TaxID=300843 RepID=A0AAW2W490_SESRA
MSDMMNELIKLLKRNNTPTAPITNYANFVSFDEQFAGNTSSLSEIDLNCWIIDSGATNHICANIALFQSFIKTSYTHFIHLPDGSKKSVSCIGVVKLNDSITLDHVLFIPEFSVNLLSISQLCRSKPYHLQFTQNSCILQDHDTKESMVLGVLFKKLYIFQHCNSHCSLPLSTPSFDVSCSSTLCNSVTWHNRLGHASLQAIKHIPDVISSDAVSEMPCDACHKAKQTRIPFPMSSSHSLSSFDLVHLDLWGPYKEPNLCGCSYVLTLVDDHSRSVWTFLITHKSQVPHTLKHFCSLIQTQFNKRIKVLRSDNGSEFINMDCKSLCNTLGIVHQTSCSYTPQQNGRVERKHRHLLNVARAILFHASLPLKFWGDSILTATFLINRTPTQLLNWKTPYELLYGTQPAYDLLKVFGSLCYATNISPQKTKFQSRATKCVMIGYAMHQKAYKLFDLGTKKVFFSRDVHFYEHIFPFATDQPITTPSSPPLPIVSIHSDDHSSSTINDIQPISDNSSPTVTTAPSESSSPVILPVPQTQPPQLRRSLRQTQKPVWLDDFVSHSHTSKYLSSSNAAYLSFVASLSILQEPRTYSEAVLHKEWREAMNAEIEALELNKTWQLTPLPTGKRPIGCKWVFKTKLRADGTVERYKARLVAKGFNQVEGVDYTDSFSPVAKTVTVRVFLAFAAAKGWPLHQLDMNNAFLHGHLDEDLYMTPPEGYIVKPGLVCKLERSLYGLKQASRQWNVELTVKLKAFGFIQSAHDHCLFTRQTASGLMVLMVYVDDILVTGSCLAEIQVVKDYLH